MTIREVSEKYGLSQDTLRYYERVGAIPEVNRTSGGIRDYTEEDLKWVKNAICLRDAGVSIEAIAEYVKLFRQGEETIEARLSLLTETREQVLAAKKKYDEALERLNFKIERYEQAVKTGVLDWSDKK
jgi:MerR family transcriptional regulator, aldehyde-responsive regulator